MSFICRPGGERRNEYRILLGNLLKSGHFEDKDGDVNWMEHFRTISNDNNLYQRSCARILLKGEQPQILLTKLLYIVRFEVFMAVTMKNGVFWVVTPCGSCKNQRGKAHLASNGDNLTSIC
jgi:hypothetical protein